MKHISCFLLIVFCIMFFASILEAQNQYLPFMGGQRWTCTQGNFNDPQGSSNPTHVNNEKSTSMKYAWDFVPSGGCLGQPIVAPMEGEIVYVSYIPNNTATTGWGNVILLKTEDDCFELPHFVEIFVKNGEMVTASQVLGLCGTTGSSTAPHCHFQRNNLCTSTNDQSIESAFIDVASDNGIPKEDKSYRSGNTHLFDEKQQQANLGSVLQDPTDSSNPTGIFWFHPFSASNDLNCYIAKYYSATHGDSGESEQDSGLNAIVYDALHGARQPYVISDRHGFYQDWIDHEGPWWTTIGMPISDEYYYADGIYLQDFQYGFLYWSSSTGLVVQSWRNADTGYAPGMLASGGWSNQFSYLFIDTYNRFGRKAGLGFAQTLVNQISVSSDTNYFVQDFKSRQNTISRIMYNPANDQVIPPANYLPPNLDYGHNRAFLLDRFWNSGIYLSFDGYTTMGAPISEQMSMHYVFPREVTQFFEKGWLVYLVDSAGHASRGCFMYNKGSTEKYYYSIMALP